MANKYCNLDGSKKIKDEFKKINVGFDKVQEDVASIIVTPAEGVSEQEIIQARKGETSLGNKIDDIDSKYIATNERVNNIITTPADGISQQEIIDARQGSVSLGANIGTLKEDLVAHKEDYEELVHYYALTKGVCPLNNWELGTIVTSTGSDYVSDKYVRSMYLLVQEGTIVKYTDEETIGGVAVFQYSLEDKTFIKYIPSGNKEIVIDIDCYIRLSVFQPGQTTITDLNFVRDKIFITIPNSIEAHTMQIKEIENTNINQSILNGNYSPNQWQLGTMNVNTGVDYVSDKYIRSDFILVEKGTIITFDETVVGGVATFQYTVEDKTFIKMIPSGSLKIVIDTDCYIRLSVFQPGQTTITDINFVRDKIFIAVPNSIRNIAESMSKSKNVYVFSVRQPIDFDLINKKIIFPPFSSLYTEEKMMIINSASSTENLVFDIPETVTDVIHLMFINTKSNTLDLQFVHYQKLLNGNSELSSDYEIIGYVLCSRTKSNCKVYFNCDKYTLHNELPIPDNSITQNKLVSDNIVKSKFYYYEDLTGIYKVPEIEGVEAGTVVDIASKNSAYLINLYDQLMNENPDYITKRLIGYGSTTEGLEDTNLPIYEYSFEPIRTRAINTVNKPILLIQSGMHGLEKTASWATYLFFKDLCDKVNNQNDVKSFLRRNITFKLVPICNPHGFNNHIRRNIRGIDVNANFDTDFIIRGETDSYFAGYEPMTEQETLTIDRWYQEYKGKVIGVIDVHNFAGLPDNDIGCYFTGTIEARTMMRSIADYLAEQWLEFMPQLKTRFPNKTSWSRVFAGEGGTSRNQAEKKYNIRAINVDPLNNISYITGAKFHDRNALFVSLSGLGATVVGMVRNFR